MSALRRLTLLAVLAMLTGALVSPAPAMAVPADIPPASAAVLRYQFPPGVLSPQFREGTCIYRIWYGNYGATPFAKVRLYGGDCREVGVTVYGQVGSSIYTSSAPNGYTGGQDCGGQGYLEKQATGGTPLVGVGMALWFPATGRSYLFWHDSGATTVPYRYCP